MLALRHRKGTSLVSPASQRDKSASNLKDKSTIELLRLRGKHADTHPDAGIIQAELNLRQRSEYLISGLLIIGVIILMIVITYM